MKKGFTLIELLSVIVVLAIIVVVAAPTLIGLIDKTRLNALKDSAYGLIEASNFYYAQYGTSNVRFDINDYKITSSDTTDMLKYKGKIKNGVVILKENGQSVICITDGKNSAYKNYNESQVNLGSGKLCTIPSNTYVIYLDGEATLNELSNSELTDVINGLKDKVDALEDKVNTLQTENNTLKEQMSTKTTKNEIYPVGSIYMSINNANPSTLFGGTWQKIEGRFLLGSGSSYSLGSTGGNTSVSYTPQGAVGNHTLTVNEMPSHNHGINGTIMTWMGYSGNIDAQNGIAMGGISIATNATGGSQAHNHPFTGTQASIQTMPPYIVVNVWKRIA